MATRGEAAEPRPAWLGFAPALFLLFWCAGFSFGKLGLAHAESMTFLALRYGCVLLVLLPLVAARARVGGATTTGLVAAAGALAAITAGTLYEKRFGVRHHPVTANTVQYAVAFAAILPLAIVVDEMRVDRVPQLWIALGYLVVCNSLIAITLLLAMIRHGQASAVSALFFLVPPGAALIAWVVLGETMPLLAWPGIGLAGRGGGPATPAPPPPARAR